MQCFFGGGETALHVVCEHGHVHVATLLLQHGAVVDSQDEVRLLYVSMVNMVCHRKVCSVWSNVECHMIVSNYHSCRITVMDHIMCTTVIVLYVC